MEYDLPNYLTRTVLLAAQSVAANTNTAVLDLAKYNGKVLIAVNPGANTAGDSTAVTVNLFDSADNSTFATCNVNSTSITGTAGAQVLTVDTRATRRYLKGVAAIAGTNSPAIPLAVDAYGQLRYNAI